MSQLKYHGALPINVYAPFFTGLNKLFYKPVINIELFALRLAVLVPGELNNRPDQGACGHACRRHRS
jgi:hypothetical protein